MVTTSHFLMGSGPPGVKTDIGSIWVDTDSGNMYSYDGQKWMRIEANLRPKGCLPLGSKVPVGAMRLAALDTG